VLRVEHCPADAEIVAEGVEQTVSRVLIEGWAGRTKSLVSGKRQVTELHLAGDFVDLHSVSLRRLDHSIVALTPCRTALFPHEALRAMIDRSPRLARALWASTLRDAAAHRQWLAVLGQLPAIGQIAHLLCEIEARLAALGRVRDGGFELPLTQEDVADCLAITPVHVNRMVQQLRSDGLIEWRRGRMTLLDLDRLRRLAEFDPAYLGLQPPRGIKALVQA
jgi:CRP-like cAMP-binding protein